MAISVDIQTLESSALLASAILSGLEEWRQQGRLDPLSLDLARSLPRMTRSVGCVLAWTKLRWSDAHLFDQETVFKTESFEVQVSKTGQVREIDPIRPAGDPSRFDAVPDSALLDICSYSQLNNEIHRTRAKLGIHIPGISKDGTHSFRHLHASWMKYQGYTLEEIRDFFGHQEKSVTDQYVHESIEFGV